MAYKHTDKENAKELYVQGYSITEISNKLDINRGTLTNWMNQYKWKSIKIDSLDSNAVDTTKDNKLILKNIIKQAQYLLSQE